MHYELRTSSVVSWGYTSIKQLLSCPRPSVIYNFAFRAQCFTDPRKSGSSSPPLACFSSHACALVPQRCSSGRKCFLHTVQDGISDMMTWFGFLCFSHIASISLLDLSHSFGYCRRTCEFDDRQSAASGLRLPISKGADTGFV